MIFAAYADGRLSIAGSGIGIQRVVWIGKVDPNMKGGGWEVLKVGGGRIVMGG